MIIKLSCASCNKNEMSSLKFSPWNVSSSCPPTVWGIVHLGAQIPPIAVPTSHDKQGLKCRRKRVGQNLDIFTCSPWADRKLVQPCRDLALGRSGREPRYLPSESYLGENEDNGDNDDDLNTCPPSHGCHSYQHPRSGRIRFDWRRQHKFPIHHFEGKTSSRLWCDQS